MLNSQQVLQIHPSDNVLVALQNIAAGTIVFHKQQAYTLIEEIPAKHKFFIITNFVYY
jgi:altronate hydrolase